MKKKVLLLLSIFVLLFTGSNVSAAVCPFEYQGYHKELYHVNTVDGEYFTFLDNSFTFSINGGDCHNVSNDFDAVLNYDTKVLKVVRIYKEEERYVWRSPEAPLTTKTNSDGSISIEYHPNDSNYRDIENDGYCDGCGIGIEFEVISVPKNNTTVITVAYAKDEVVEDRDSINIDVFKDKVVLNKDGIINDSESSVDDTKKEEENVNNNPVDNIDEDKKVNDKINNIVLYVSLAVNGLLLVSIVILVLTKKNNKKDS